MNCLATRSRAKYFNFFSAALMLVLFARVGVRAQDLDDVSFGGTVADENGAVLPGATVTATLLSTKSARTATTDGEGRYRLFELQPQRRADADGLRLVKVGQVGFVATFFAVHKALAFAHPLDHRGALLAMALRADDGREASHLDITLVEELLE